MEIDYRNKIEFFINENKMSHSPLAGTRKEPPVTQQLAVSESYHRLFIL